MGGKRDHKKITSPDFHQDLLPPELSARHRMVKPDPIPEFIEILYQDLDDILALPTGAYEFVLRNMPYFKEAGRLPAIQRINLSNPV